MHEHETQESICAWADETFGQTTFQAAYDRYWKEVAELDDVVQRAGLGAPDMPRIMNECADVLITLYRVAQEGGFDLHEAVNVKMRVNRARTWRSNGDGTGQHAPDGAQTGT